MPTMLAMHMANELLTPPVAGVTWILAAAAVAAASVRARKTLSPERAPLMGVMGAFVFAAQMINFTLPLMPGTSGHLGGGVLLAILLGPAAGIVTMAAILIVQCLLFQDGGLLALGCNILNMGVVPCLLGWGLYRALLGPAERARPARQYLSAWAACTVGVAGGAALVPVESSASGVLRIEIGDFLLVMVGVHLLIGLIEGAITFAVLAYLRQVRPEAAGLTAPAPKPGHLGKRAVLGSLAMTALLLAGLAGWFASTHPDGLEWTYQEHFARGAPPAVQNPSPLVARVDAFQTRWSPMTDYTRRSAPLGQEPAGKAEAEPPPAAWPNVSGWGSLAGVLGTAVTLGLLFLAGGALRRRRPAPGPPQTAPNP
ncbi:MAG: energy-coupling factor ABC transporter permease [Phycisphaerae bacterium]|nr:energy-coupling factor ABC transporter permease [Phycisphaerae bacterium]